MALIRLGAMIADIRGKVGGNYFSTSAGSPVLRVCPPKGGKGKPAKLASPKKAMRSVVSTISKDWKRLDVDNMKAWGAYASTLTFFNKLGMPYTPSGYEVYCKRNFTLDIHNRDLLSEPVTDESLADINLFKIDIEPPEGIVLFYDSSVAPAATMFSVFASAACSPGVATPPGGYKQIYSSTNVPLSVITLTAQYIDVFGTAPTYGSIFLRIDVYSSISGIQNGSKLTKADAGFV